jgi:murein DD-endopeptidase MepM/ murein hydrolase activator NlpD
MEKLTPVRPASIIGNTRLKELKTIKGVATNLISQKKKNFDLEKKFFKFEKDSITRARSLEKERQQEQKKPKSGAAAIKKEIKEQSVKLYDLFKFFVGYKVLQWMSKTENIKSLGEIAKAMQNIFKVIDYLAGIGVEGVLGGLHSVLFGGSFLERFFGVFKAIGGLFIIRRLLSPGKILKDIAWILNNKKNISRVFKAIGSGKFKEAIGRIFKLLNPTLYTTYTKGLTAGIKRVVLKVFGKNALKFLTKVASKIGFASAKQFVKNTIKTAAKPLSRIPLVGPILGFGLNLIFGDPLDKAAVKLIGSSIGAWLGGIVMGALGSIIPVAGTAAGAGFGAVVGGLVGDWVGDKLYGFFKGFTAPKEPALAVGGIVTKPTRALIGEAGPEAVIPLPRIYDGTILNAPIGIVASSMIGGMDAVITSLGPIGLTIRPYASSLLSPYRREFGSSNYVFTSNIRGATNEFDIKESKVDNKEVEKIIGLNKTLNIISKKESTDESKKSRYNSGNSIREILADILNNIINLDFTKKKSTRPRRPGDPTGDIGDLTGEVDLSSADDRTLLKQLALAEAAGEGVIGMALVVNSVLNRKRVLDGGASTTLYHATDKTIRGIIYAKQSVQYTPVSSGTINKQWGKGSLDLAEKALEMGMDKAKLKSALESEGIDANTVKILLNATGFRNYASAGIDTSQQVNEVNYKRHTFNTAGVAKMQTGGVVNPVPSQNIASNKGGYAADTGLDILTPIGSKVVSPVSGILEYAEKGHVRQMGQDANPNMSGMQDQHSVRIKLDNPFKFAGKQVNFFYATHLYQLNSSIANKSGIKINAGDLLGLSGVANNVPHVHVGFVEDRNQNTFLNYQQVRSLLSGSPVQNVNEISDSLHTPTGSDIESDSTDQQPAFNPTDVANNLAKLYQMLNAPAKFNGAQMEKDSMKHLQAFKDFAPSPDTYIVMGGTNIVSSTNLITPMKFPDYSVGSFSGMDSATAFNLKTRL